MQSKAVTPKNNFYSLCVFELIHISFLFCWQGCVNRVVGWVQAQSGLITGVGVGVGVLEVAGLVAAASLCRAIRSSDE